MTKAIAEEFSHKVRIFDDETALEIENLGGRLVRDYGTWRLYETTNLPNNLARHPLNEVRDEYNFIELAAGRIDTRIKSTDTNSVRTMSFPGRRLELVQFAGTVCQEWRASLEATGVSIVSYIPENAYLVHGDSNALAQLHSLASSTNCIQWEGPYEDVKKIHPSASALDANGNPRQIGTTEFCVQLIGDDEENPRTFKFLQSLNQGSDLHSNDCLCFRNFILHLNPDSLSQIAACPDVISIQPFFPPHKSCERQDQIAAGNLTGALPTGPGYLAWLASLGFTQAQFNASGLVVDVVDSGIDNGTSVPGHFGLYETGNLAGQSHVAYNRLVGSPNASSTLQGCDGHGNINAHIIAGYDDNAGFPCADSSGFHYGLGVCPFVSVGSSVIFDPYYYTYPNFIEIESRAWQGGARISNNSWNFSGSAGNYDSTAQVYDSLVRDSQPSNAVYSATGNQQMVIVVSAGNDGASARTIDTPASAKNVISVGAAANVQPFGATELGGIADSAAQSANDVWSLSSRGPCADGRCKPDICAPGTHVSGGAYDSVTDFTDYPDGIAAPCFTGWSISGGTVSPFWPNGQQFYTASSGTSQAAPCISGGCALVMQYFYNQNGAWPSPAMVKAFLVNSSRYLTGSNANDTLPSFTQGMGEINLGTAFDGTPRIVRDQLSSDMFKASGTNRTFSGTIFNTNVPFRVTLAWTDAPGSTAGNAYNNNLDLVVTVGTNTFKGNVFNGAYSTTGGSSDLKNNVENVFLPPGAGTNYVVSVLATSINSLGVPGTGDKMNQDFALVIYNALQPGTTNPVTITAAPTNSIAVAGSEAVFQVSAAGGTPLFYQWRVNSNVIPSATNSSLAVTNLLTNMSGSYYSVVVSNTFSMATSAAAALTVVARPALAMVPGNFTGLLGTNIILTANATGGMLSYTWSTNGTVVANAVSNTFAISNLSPANSGLYAVLVSNLAGTAAASATIGATLPKSVMVMTNKSPSISLTTVPGFNYVLQYKTSLRDTNWINILPARTGNGGAIIFSDPSPSPNARFYRVTAY